LCAEAFAKVGAERVLADGGELEVCEEFPHAVGMAAARDFSLQPGGEVFSGSHF